LDKEEITSAIAGRLAQRFVILSEVFAIAKREQMRSRRIPAYYHEPMEDGVLGGAALPALRLGFGLRVVALAPEVHP
jgi:hypothetical protein